MPAPGDQHASMANPFEAQRPQISAYTAQEIATLHNKLEKQLGPEYLSARKGPSGQTVHYITADKCITLANEIFGFNGWSSSVQNLQVDFVDEETPHKINLGLHVIVRVTLRDGTYHEDIGYGHIENARTKASAFEKAKKEGTTDALKRALRQFGNVLGNCIYDKAYLAKATKMKVVQPKFNEDALHRHPDFAQKKSITAVESKPVMEAAVVPQAPPQQQQQQQQPPPPPPQLTSVESFEDFDLEDADDFDISTDHPDFVVLPNSNDKDSNDSIVPHKSHEQQNGWTNIVPQPPARPLARASSAGNPPRPAPQTPVQVPSRPVTSTNHFPGAGGQSRGPAAANQPPSQPTTTTTHNPTGAPPAIPTGNEPVTFFSARTFKGLAANQSVGSLGEGALAVPKPGQAFNPHLESPSIPRTPGIDHSASKPLSRSGVHVTGPPVGWKGGAAGEGKEGATAGGAGGAGGGGQQPPPPPQPQQGAGLAGIGAPRPVGAPPGRMGGNAVGGGNPMLDNARRIGAPGGPGSPLGNRGQFRPLTVKRPVAAVGAGEGQVGRGGGGAAVAVGRMPLGDVNSNGVIGGPGGAGPDVKRQRTS